MAGYSVKPLPEKLGIQEGFRVAFLRQPRGFPQVLGRLPADTYVSTSLRSKVPFDVIVYFVKTRSELAARFPLIAQHLDPAGGLWVAWPKKASGVQTDLTESGVREIALSTGLADNKVCAIDDVWSGLRFVVREKDRRTK